MNLQTLDKQGTPSRGSSHLTPTDIGKTNHKAKPGDPGQDSIDRVMKLARITGSAQYYAPQDPNEGLEWLPNYPESLEPPHNQTVLDPVSGGASTQSSSSHEVSELPQPTHPQTQATIPQFSESSISKLKSQGLTQMEQYVGRNLEDRGGLGRVKEVAKNYVESLGDIATDRPPSCHEPDIPGQGTKQRDQHLKTDKRKDEYMKEINHKMISTSVNTCNSCNHDLPPEDKEYAEMEDTPFSSYQDVTIRPRVPGDPGDQCCAPSRRTSTHGARPRATTFITCNASCHQ